STGCEVVNNTGPCGSQGNTDCDNPDTCSGGSCQDNHKPNGTTCTKDGNECTSDVCATGACTHPDEPTGTACGSPSAGDCDDPDTCNGSGSCQDNHKPNGTTCTSDGNECTSDVCATGACTHPDEPTGTACGSPSAGDCDNPDTCNGSGSCQDNHK